MTNQPNNVYIKRERNRAIPADVFRKHADLSELSIEDAGFERALRIV